MTTYETDTDPVIPRQWEDRFDSVQMDLRALVTCLELAQDEIEGWIGLNPDLKDNVGGYWGAMIFATGQISMRTIELRALIDEFEWPGRKKPAPHAEH